MGNNRSNHAINNERLIDEDTEPEEDIPKTATLKPPVHIRRESLKLTTNSESGNQMISFVYDAYEDVLIHCYFFAIESVKALGNTDCYYIDIEKHPSPAEFTMQTGLNVQFPDTLLGIDLSKYSLTELTFADKKVYPLIIEIRPRNDIHVIETTYCKFRIEEGVYVIKVIRQKLTLNDKSYELHEIYGIKPGVQEECVVCLTNAKNTVVMPCRHFCLCLPCAVVVRGQNISKCPICRNIVETFINIRGTPQFK